ncbi:MAG: hypothetical protein D6731_13855 [Planctomycetota bacterium]|nr:MAG: hypothetical protein D6731_13855 [Planctomycetota bacterium]
MATSFFEGPEKKVEWVVVDGFPSLRSLGDERWEGIVRAARAQIISKLSSERCDAYLLSESTLLVYDEHATLITCGRTRLVDAVECALETIPPQAIAFLVLERKNEHFPREQPTDFATDARRLSELLPGRALRFGAEHSHAIELFHTLRPYEPDAEDTTLEVLMHGIAEAANPFRGDGGSDALARARSVGLGNVIPGFAVDDHAFTPAGYSLNALRGPHYFTFHVTPEDVGSYASFETNVDHRADPELVLRVVEPFRPQAFDVFAYAPDGEALSLEVPGYVLHQHVTAPVCGYGVSFLHFCRPAAGATGATPIALG